MRRKMSVVDAVKNRTRGRPVLVVCASMVPASRSTSRQRRSAPAWSARLSTQRRGRRLPPWSAPDFRCLSTAAIRIRPSVCCLQCDQHHCL